MEPAQFLAAQNAWNPKTNADQFIGNARCFGFGKVVGKGDWLLEANREAARLSRLAMLLGTALDPTFCP